MSDDTFDQTPGATSDDDLDDLLAVSALVDGVATAEERARVEASAELTALADDWRAQQARVGDPTVLAAPDEVRSGALAAAMAAFDEIHATPTAQAAPAERGTGSTGGKVLSFERAQRRSRLLMGAAAAVALLFVGTVMVGGGLGGSNDDSVADGADGAAAAKVAPSSETAADDQLAATSEDMTFAEESAAGTDGTAGADGATAAESDPMPMAAPSAEMSTADTNSGGGATEAVESTQAPADADPAGQITGPAEVVVSLATPEQLLDFARSRTVQLPLPGFEFPCVPAEIEALGLAEYQGLQVVVTRDPATGTVAAVELVSCDQVASISP